MLSSGLSALARSCKNPIKDSLAAVARRGAQSWRPGCTPIRHCKRTSRQKALDSGSIKAKNRAVAKLRAAGSQGQGAERGFGGVNPDASVCIAQSLPLHLLSSPSHVRLLLRCGQQRLQPGAGSDLQRSSHRTLGARCAAKLPPWFTTWRRAVPQQEVAQRA